MAQVELVRPLEVSAPGTSELKISNRGSNSIYYGDNAQVSSTNKTGTLGVGESLTITRSTVWLKAEAVPAIVDFEEKETGGVGSGSISVELPFVVVNASTSAAITAAIESIPSVTDPVLGSIKAGTVYFPPRNYVFSGPVTVPSYVQLVGLERAILSRGAGYEGLFFTNASPVSQVALNGFIWDNGGTANMMWQFPVGCSQFDHIWARYQDFTGEVGKLAPNPIIGGSAVNSDVTLRDIRLYSAGAPVNIAGLVVDDVVGLSASNIKSFPGSGATYAVGAIKVETGSGFSGLARNINIEDVEVEKTNASAVLVRPNGSSKIEDVSIKGIRGQELGTAEIPKGLVVAGEQVGGTPGSSSMKGVRVEDVEGRDWWGKLVTIGGNGDVRDFTVSGVRGDCSSVATGEPDTSRETVGLSVVGARHGEIDGVVIRNTGFGGLRFITSTFQGPAFIGATGVDVESCVQNPALPGGTWKECGILFDKGCSDISIEGRSANNYSTANPGGAEAGAGVGCLVGSETQANRIRLKIVTTDTRTPKLQDVGVRIGTSGADANQPNEWDILPGSDLTGNLTAPIYGIPGSAQAYASTDHGHRLTRVRGSGVTELFAGSTANAPTSTEAAGSDNSSKIATTKWVRSLAGSLSSRDEAWHASRKILTETFNCNVISTNVVAIATKELYGALVGFEAGDEVKGVAFEVKIEAITGTYSRSALLAEDGTLLAKSANKSAEIGATGLKEWAFESPYTITSVGGYYLAILNVFTVGKFELYRQATKPLLSVGVNGGAKPVVKQTGQSELPEKATLAGAESAPWLAAY
jgi:hypothetical protein